MRIVRRGLDVMFYRVTDYLHFARMYGRNRRRQRVWGKLYENAVRSGSFKLPVATGSRQEGDGSLFLNSAWEDSEAQGARALGVVVNRLLRDDYSGGVADRLPGVQVASIIRKHLARDDHT